MQISTQPKSTADNPSEPSTQDTPVLPNATTTATAVTAATTEKTKKRRNQCPVRHWYREGLQLRRGIITVPIDVSTVLYEPCNDVQQQQQQQQQQEGTAAPPPPPIATTTTTIDEPNSYLSRLPLAHPRQKVTDADFGASQMSVVRDFCRENEGTSFHPRQVGYIYAEKSVSGQVAAPPSEYDKYGLPTDHLKFPVVVSFENHWYLPCSLNDKCRIHHDLFFKRDPSEAAKRFAPYQVPKINYPWEDIARGEAARRFGGEVVASLGSVAGLHDVTVPPSDPSARALRDLFPDYTEDRKIWHLPGTAPTVGVCSLVPVSRLRKEDARMFLAVVVFQGGNVWIPTMEFSEVPLHVANPCQQFAIRQQPLKQPVTSIQQQQQQPLPQIEPIQAQQSQQSQQQQPEFLSPPGCMKRVEQLLLSPQSATFSAVQTWPCVKALLEACSQKTGKGELEELTVLKTSPTKVIRVVFSGKFRLKVQTIHTLEEKVTISLPQSSVRISCTELAGTSVCAECYTPSDSGSWLETSEKDSVGVVSYADESSVVSEPLVVSQKYCRCNFTYSGGSCEVVCGPNDLINMGNSVHLSQSQRSAAAAVATTTTTADTLNQPEVTSVVTAAVVLANSANDPAAPKI